MFYYCGIVLSFPTKLFGSISVSRQLPTYPSLNPTLTLTCYQSTVVELGEGYVGSCPDTDIDPTILDKMIAWNTIVYSVYFA